MYLLRTVLICSDSSLKFSSDAPKVTNSVFGAVRFVQLVSRIVNEPAATVLKIFSQCTARVARSTIRLQLTSVFVQLHPGQDVAVIRRFAKQTYGSCYEILLIVI